MRFGKEQSIFLIPGLTWKVIRNHYQQLNTIKLDKWEEMDAFLETYNILIQNQEEIESLERPIINRLNQ